MRFKISAHRIEAIFKNRKCTRNDAIEALAIVERTPIACAFCDMSHQYSMRIEEEMNFFTLLTRSNGKHPRQHINIAPFDFLHIKKAFIEEHLLFVHLFLPPNTTVQFGFSAINKQNKNTRLQ